MQRRRFIKNVGLASLLPMAGNLLWACNLRSRPTNRVFVFIQLIGGNDGLNTLIPLDNYKNVVAARPNIYIPENKVLDLKGHALTGLHPSLEGIRDMYANGLAGFVQNVGYENQSYSHFRSADIWLTGSKAEESLYTGWMARYLETRYDGYPKGFPNAEFPHPPAIKVGDTGTMLFEAAAMDMSIVVPSSPEGEDDAEAFGKGGTGEGYAAQEVKSIKEILLQSEQYGHVLREAMRVPFRHSSLYPEKGENPLADQLKVVAKLIHGGLQTSVYHVDLKGFDTHEHQADGTNTVKGVHADLLAKLSQAITCFWDDVVSMGRENDVAGMTFSEFGRRIISNSSGGTDHGAAQPLIIFGGKVTHGIIGENPVIPDRAQVMDNLATKVDFKAVYSALLKDWFGADAATIRHAVGTHLPSLQLFRE